MEPSSGEGEGVGLGGEGGYLVGLPSPVGRPPALDYAYDRERPSVGLRIGICIIWSAGDASWQEEEEEEE